MKIYGSDWLTNASIIGYTRILQSAGCSVKLEHNSVDITESDLRHLPDAYFTMVLEQYLNNAFKLKVESKNRLVKKLDKDKQDRCLGKLNDFISSAKHGDYNYTSFDISVDNQLHAFKQYQKELGKLLRILQSKYDINQNKINSFQGDIENKFIKISGDIYKQNFLPTTLRNFYFNKSIVGNYSLSKNITRYEAFIEEILNPAICDLKKTPTPGHITCKICKHNKVNIQNFEKDVINESMFSPIMVSNKTFRNFFYNGQSDLFICKLCNLILLCSWAGFTTIPYVARDGIVNADQIFLNLPDLEKSLQENDKIKNIDYKNSDRFHDTIFSDTIQNILIDKQKQKSSWVMDNLFFVELKTVSRKDSDKPNFRYYHIGKNIAKLFKDKYFLNALSKIKGKITLKNCTTINLISTVITKLVAEESIEDLCYILSKDVISDNKSMRSQELFNICLIVSIQSVLYKNGDMQLTGYLKSNQIYGIITGLNRSGNELAQKIGLDKKTKALSFVLLEAIRNNNISKFYDLVSKQYITNNLPIPKEIVSILNHKDEITPPQRAYAFISGLSNSHKEDDFDD